MVKIYLDWLHSIRISGVKISSILLLLFLSIIATLSEMIGVSIFLPIIQYIKYNGDIALLISNSFIWEAIINFMEYFKISLTLVTLMIFAFLFFIFRQVLTYYRVIYQSKMSQSMLKNYKDTLFSSYLDSKSDFYDEFSTGDLVNVVTTETSSALVGLVAPIELLVYLIMALGYMSILLVISIEMTLASIIVLLIVSYLPKHWIKRSGMVGKKIVEINNIMSSFLVERLRFPHAVKMSGSKKIEKQRFHKLTNKQMNLAVKGSYLQAKTEVVIEPVVILLGLTFIYISYEIFDMSIELMGLYLLSLFRLMPIIKSMLVQVNTVKRYKGSIDIIEKRLKKMYKMKEYDLGTKTLDSVKSSVRFKNVYYMYPNANNYALNDINITIPANNIIVILGSSGSGKSTLVNMLPRIRTQVSGSIYFDEVDLDQYSLSSLRSVISYVAQSPQVFNGTIEDHIRYGNADVTDDVVNYAIDCAGIRNYVASLPNGAKTIIQEDGRNLSGGQRQRLDLARAIAEKSSILILDEPTSNLDYQSELRFMSNLSAVSKHINKTILIITHNISHVKYADLVILMSEGRIEGFGAHDDLYNKNIIYTDMYNHQYDNDHKVCDV